MQSSLSFVSTVQDFIGQHPEAPLKDIRLFWNRMDSRTSKELYVMYNAIVLRMGLKVFETVLPDLERFNKEMPPSSRQHFRCLRRLPRRWNVSYFRDKNYGKEKRDIQGG